MVYENTALRVRNLLLLVQIQLCELKPGFAAEPSQMTLPVEQAIVLPLSFG